MISYFQRHRKFLVIVLGITVFAFVGAGFVGWGSYSYGAQAGAVAEVGNENITLEQYRSAYSNLHNFYSQFSDQPLNEEMESGLQQMALNTLINEAMLINFAHDLGLTASAEEASKEIMAMEVFWLNGRFDKPTYIAALANVRRDVKSFEAEIARQILIKKLSSLLQLPATQSEKNALAASLYATDRITYKLISAPRNITISNTEAQQYYENNKLQFMGEPRYDIEYIKLDAATQEATEKEAQDYYDRSRSEFLDAAGEILPFENVKTESLFGAKMAKARREAMSAKIAWRDGAKEPQSAKGVELINSLLSQEVMEQLELAQSLEISNPIEVADGFVVARIAARYASEPLPFERAKELVIEELKRQATEKYLKTESEKQLPNFTGVTTAFITKSDFESVVGLSESEASQFLEQVFGSTAVEGVVELEDKAVLYRIVEQKLFDTNKALAADGMLGENVVRLKTSQIQQGLLETLKSRYRVTLY